jgi:A/G-specific adenine glycosylase
MPSIDSCKALDTKLDSVLQDFCTKNFTTPLLAWFDLNGRKNLPWQSPYHPYKVWLSEVMLQQTQVKTVIPYFTRFISRFPNIQDLSQAPEDDILMLWSGLGYYSRARNLHRTAQIIVEIFGGVFPQEREQLLMLPGIGASTAAAIRSLAFEEPDAILDGNVKRVLSRYFLIEGALNQREIEKKLLSLASMCLSQTQPRAYTQAIMDLGATCCTPKNPTCSLCPLQNHCQAYQTKQVELFPYKTLRKSIPQKTVQFFLLHTDSLIYLEKRPHDGIWGGLWCLPYRENLLSQQTQGDDMFMQFKHSFTHFQWHIQVFRKSLHNNDRANLKLSGNWVTQKQVATLGLPAPMKSILGAHWTQVDEMKARL